MEMSGNKLFAVKLKREQGCNCLQHEPAVHCSNGLMVRLDELLHTAQLITEVMVLILAASKP